MDAQREVVESDWTHPVTYLSEPDDAFVTVDTAQWWADLIVRWAVTLAALTVVACGVKYLTS